MSIVDFMMSWYGDNSILFRLFRRGECDNLLNCILLVTSDFSDILGDGVSRSVQIFFIGVSKTFLTY